MQCEIAKLAEEIIICVIQNATQTAAKHTTIHYYYYQKVNLLINQVEYYYIPKKAKHSY